ncbi:MAG: RNA methyltransferase [Planctomycetota bacterium]|nr:RNA methyltransferase [Planctomycetota bacterium]MDA1113277.1 RNA methyltransferase [Planctomycetota bacterium]
MELEVIQSAQNAKLKSLRGLRAGKEREFTALEGRHLLEDALAAGAKVLWVLVREGEDLEDPLLQQAEAVGAEIAPCDGKLMLDASRLDSPPDFIAWVERPCGDWKEAFAASEPGQWWLVAAGVQDPGNLGALARVAAGFGAVGLLCLKGGVSPWHPRALRGASGTTFRLPVFEGVDSSEFLAFANDSHVELWATATDGEDLNDVIGGAKREKPIALLLGEEGRGLDPWLFAACSRKIGISLARDVDSLNVATAAAVFGWALREK